MPSTALETEQTLLRWHELKKLYAETPAAIVQKEPRFDEFFYIQPKSL